MKLRPRNTPPEIVVAGEMAKDDERAANANVRRFARSQPTRKPYNDPVKLDVASESTGDLHSAFMSVGSELLKYTDKPATLATIGTAFHRVAERIAPSGAPKAPTVGERDTSGLFGTPAPERHGTGSSQEEW
jgi:hypothetical protein